MYLHKYNIENAFDSYFFNIYFNITQIIYYLKYISFIIHLLFLLFGPIALKKKLGWFGLQKTETKLKLKQNIFHINVIISHSKYTY